MAEDARPTSFRRTLLAAAAATVVVAMGATAFLDHSTRSYVSASSSVDRLATAVERPWASPRTLRVDPTPVGSISRPGKRPQIKNTITDPAAGMPQ